MVGKYGLFIALAAVIIAVTNAKPPQKIIGGSPASLGEFPYMVDLRLNGVHLCGGTIIGKRHIITAAHCIAGIVSRPYTGFDVVTGTISGSGGKTHPVKAIHYHAGYNTFSQSSPNDVAIITLESDIKFDQYTQKVAMPTSATPSGVMATVAGWGYTSTNSGVSSNTLLKIRVKTLAADQCQKHLTGISQLYTHQICTHGAPGRGVCSGDSGGPLVYNGQFIGVVSYVIPCGLGYPDVYTSVYHYIDWIQQTIATT